MAIGRMNRHIDIVNKVETTDSDGFLVVQNTVLHSVRAYREGRHGSKAWSNRASFTSATDLFVIRKIPNFMPTTKHFIQDGFDLFEITSVEDVKGRNMYIEILAKEVKPSG